MKQKMKEKMTMKEEKKLELKEYLHAIFDIAKENNMSWDVGMDMFIANIRNAGQPDLPYYEGGEEIDYEALKPVLAAMDDEAVADMKNSFCDYVRGDLPAIIRERRAMQAGQ